MSTLKKVTFAAIAAVSLLTAAVQASVEPEGVVESALPTLTR